MIRINLLPFRAARRKENVRRQISIFLLFFFLTAIALGFYHVSLSGKISRLNKDIAATKKELNIANKKAKQVDAIKRKLKILKQKTNIIKNLEANRREPVILLDVMTTTLVPKRMWLTSFKYKGRAVSITGIALDQKTVADYMSRLENANICKKCLYSYQPDVTSSTNTKPVYFKELPKNWKCPKCNVGKESFRRLFKSVKLNTIVKKKVKGANLKSFSITCRKRALAKPAAKTKKKKK